MKENSIEEDIKILEGIIKGDEDCINAIYSQMKVKNANDEDIQYYKKEIQSIKNIVDNYLKEKARADKLEKEYSAMLTKLDENECDYKRVLKENEEKTTILLAGAEKVKQLEKENKKLKEDRNNNNEMVALARNEVLNYMTGYEDGKKHKMTATVQVVENQQYYIIQKQMEKYEEHIKRLQKENEELKNKIMEKDLEIIGKEEYTKASMGEIIEQYYTANEDCIPKQRIEDIIDRIDYDIKKTKEIISNNTNIYATYRKNDYQIVRLRAMNTKSLDIKKRLQKLLESEE